MSAREGEARTLYLIDGMAQLFRAYHAIRTPMTSPVTKEPTNATFGFVAMILKVLDTLHPDYLAVAIDVSSDRETFRSELYPEYKANREAPPEALPPQIERCLALLREIGVPVIGVETYEADDVIATIVDRMRGSHPEVRVRLVSKDKDLQQLIEPGRVEMFDVHTDEKIDADKLMEVKGITPAQVVDMLTLMGDTVDNVPGVEGIGPKTAAQLIAQWGTLDELLAHADEIKGKRGERIREAAPRLPLSKDLVTLRRDAPVEFDLDDASVTKIDLRKLVPILQELGFNRHTQEAKRIAGMTDGEGVASAAPAQRASAASDDGGGLFAMHEARDAAPPLGTYHCVRTTKDLDALVKALKGAPLIAIDTETTGLSPLESYLCGVSISLEEGEAWYIPVRAPEGEKHLDAEAALDALRPVLEDESVPKCGHNVKFDQLVLRRAGVELRGVAFDSMIASFLVDSSRSSHSMNALSLALLGHACIPISDLIGTGKSQKTFDTVALDRATVYAAEDADVTLRLRNALAPQLESIGLAKLNNEVETPLVEVLAELEWNGIRVDPDELDRQADRLNARITELRAEIVDAAPRDFNPDSPKQLSSILFNTPDAQEPGLGLKPIKKTKTGYSTDVEVLEKLAADPAIGSSIPALIVEHRQLTKLVGTYLVALKEAINPDTGRIHASFNQTVAATGRLSSSDPNLQNIPIRTEIGRDIRKAFVAPEGRVLIGADYSQIELRLLAHLSRDPALIEAFRDDQDIHRAVAAQIHGVDLEAVTREQRDGAKMVNFGIVYGITPFGLARRLGVSNDEASGIIDAYKKRFAGITTFLQECVQQAQEKGYVETVLGRRRPIPQIESRNPSERSLGERMAINSVVQGSAADLIKLAMLDLHARLSAHALHWRRARGMGEKPEIEGVQMLLQIHDELVFEAPREVAERARALIVERMEQAMELDVPLKVEASVSANWFEGK